MADVEKSKSQTLLGISVVSTAEGKDPSRHFICNILPEGAVGKTGLIRVDDELLAVSVYVSITMPEYYFYFCLSYVIAGILTSRF